jgi:hypothetical protein
METSLGVDVLFVEEVIGRLRLIEERKKKLPPLSSTSMGRLLFIMEEWIALLKPHTFMKLGMGRRTKKKEEKEILAL